MSATPCKHIIAYADERDARPCPVCELSKWKKEHEHLSNALVDLQVQLTDIHLPLIGLLEETRKTVKALTKRVSRHNRAIFAIQQRHGHLKKTKIQ